MARVAPIVNSLTAGEVSPKLYGRTDLEKYNSGAKTLLNCLVAPHGGAYFRYGTVFVAKAKYADKECRLLEFEFNVEQAYVIEMGEGYFRFYKDGGQIRNTGIITGATNANPAVITEVGHGRLTDDVVDLDSLGGIVELNGNAYAITYVDADHYSLTGVDSSGYGTYTSGGTADGPYTIANSFTEAELFEVQTTQSNDVLWLVHENHIPQRLSRTSHTSWTLADESFVDGPYNPQNMTESYLFKINGGSYAIGDVVTLSASGHSPLTAAHIGMMMRLEDPADPANTVWGTITAYASSTSASLTLGSAAPASLQNVNVYTWRYGAFNAVMGYPRVVTLYEQRIWYSSTTEKPQTFWGSVIDDYSRFRLGVNADDSIIYTIASKSANTIQWIEGVDELITGTQGSEWRVSGGTQGITPTNKAAKRQTSRGNDHIQPIMSGNSIIHVQRAGHKVREMLYSDKIAGYESSDLTIISEHLLRNNSVIDMAYQEERNSIIWIVRDDGDLLGLTYELAQQVVAWHPHSTDGKFKSISSIPTATHDQIWVATKRTINSVEGRYIEYFFEAVDNVQANSYHVDCGLTYNGAAATVISGLDHLIGETVKVVADGAVHKDLVVDASGQISLDFEAEVVHVGLGYAGKIELLDADAGSQNGTAQGKKKRWSDVKVRFYESAGFIINGEHARLREATDLMDAAVPLFSGIYEVENLGWDTAGTVTIEQDQPLPMNVLMVTGTLTTSDS